MMKKFLTLLCVVLMTLFAAACTQENNAVLPDANAVADSREHTATIYRVPADGTEKLYAEKVTVKGDKEKLPLLALEALINTKPQSDKLINAFPEGWTPLSAILIL